MALRRDSGLMVSLSQLLAFGVAALVLVALATVLGNSLGLLVVLALVAVGLGMVVQESIAVFTVLKLLGAGYLVYLGIQAVRHRHGFTVPDRRTTDAVLSRCRAVRQGFVVGVSNPKAFMIFAAVLPQFVDRGAGHAQVQMLLLGVLAFCIALGSDSLWALLAARLRTRFHASPRRGEAMGAVGGLSMIGLGVAIAVTGRPE